MTQNRSTAVMQRRRVAPDALDYFPTPPFATRALCEWLEAQRGSLAGLTVWEPACGEMHMVAPLRQYFGDALASDVHRYGPDHELLDFPMLGALADPVDWVITNPPFRLAQAFVEAGLKVARVGVAMLLRVAFLEGEERHGSLFSRLPPAFVLPFVERVAMFEGRLVQKGKPDPFNENRPAATATAYCWFVWLKGETDTRLRWIAPCRARLERPGDYPAYELPLPEAA